MTYAMAEQQSLFDLDIWSGKTYQEPLAQTAEKTSKPSSQKSSGLSSKDAPMFLCLTKENGPNMGQLVTKWGGGVWLGGRMMHNIGEFHNGAEGYVLLPTSTEQQQPMFYLTLNCGEKPRIKNPTKLSEILEESPDEKYRLSARACSGILNRAERRGKELPPQLEAALRSQSVSRNEQENQGGGKGILIQHEHVGALSTLNNQSVLCLNDQGGSVIGCSEDIGPTLRAQDHGHAPAVIDVCAGFKAGQSMAGGIGWEKEKAATLSANCSGTEPTVFDGRLNADKIKAYGIDHVITTGGYCTAEGPCIYPEIEATLKAAGTHSVYDARGNGDGFTVPTITGDHENRITDYTAIVAGYKSFGDYEITETGKSLLESDDVTTGDLIINNRKNIGIVRRLTPLECTRLQGYPDGWCDIGEWVDSKGKKHADADSPKYKALGNSIAIPFWQWLARRIAAQYENAITMGSLFDGIGGFPLSFERAGGKAIWASEIEPFCVAVTKRRFSE